MGVESVSVAEALSHADTLKKSHVIPLLEYCCQLRKPWKAKDIQAIEGIQRTFKITEVQYLNYWGRLNELKLYSLQRRRERYIIIIYLEDNTAYGAKYWWHNGAQNKNQKTHKTWNTVSYSVSNKQKPSIISSKECNNCIRASVVQLVAKISARHRKWNWKIQIWARQISEAHSWWAKNAQLCHRIRQQHPHSSEGSRNLPKWWSPRLGHGEVLAASKPLQVPSK